MSYICYWGLEILSSGKLLKVEEESGGSNQHCVHCLGNSIRWECSNSELIFRASGSFLHPNMLTQIALTIQLNVKI